MPIPFARACRDLRRLGGDRRSGAAGIASRAVEILVRYCERTSSSKEKLRAELIALAVDAQRINRSMTPLLLLSNRLLLAAEEEQTRPNRLRRDLLRWQAEQSKSRKRMAARFARLVPRQAIVVTYSASSAVAAALLTARKKIDRVILSEGRPAMEGTILARQLAASGMRVTLTTDGALPSLVGTADLVVVGADAVCRRRFVNKVGTEALRLAARKSRIPFLVLADSAKFTPRGLERWVVPVEGPQRQIAGRAHRRITRANPIFEFVLRGPSVTILYGDGALTGSRMPQWVGRIPIAKWWRRKRPESFDR